MKSFLKTMTETCLCILLALFVCGVLLCIGLCILFAPPNIIYEKTKFPVTEKILIIEDPDRFTNLPVKPVKENWTSYTTGVLGDGIRSMAFDKEGFLWTVGSGGAVRWNLSDHTYTKYTTEHGVVTNNLFSVTVAPDGVVWVGGESGGISTFDGKDWVSEEIPENRWNDEIRALLIHPNHTVWAGVFDKGVFVNSGNTWDRIITEGAPAYEEVTNFLRGSDNSIWVGVQGHDNADEVYGHGGVYHFDGTKWINYQYDDGLLSNVVTGITEYPSGIIWVSTYSGIARFDGKNWTNYTSANGLLDNHISTVFSGSDNAIWFGTRKGLSRFDGKSWINYNLGFSVTSLTQDMYGTLWFSSEKGLHSLKQDHLATYLTEDIFHNNFCQSIKVDVIGDIWCTTIHDETIKYKAERTTGNESLVLSQEEPIYFLKLVSNGAWIGTNNGIFFQQNDNRQKFTLSIEGCNNSPIFREDILKNLWTVCGSRIWKFNGSNWNRVTYSGDKKITTINAINSTRDGSVWFVTESGVFRFLADTWTDYINEDGSPCYSFISVGTSTDGSIWAVSEGGISRYNDKKWALITTFDTPDLKSGQTLVSSSGFTWIPTYDGVVQYDITARKRVLTNLDGLGSKLVKDVSEAPDGSIWFATKGGLSRFKEP